jgi:hypothetical protein
MKPENLRKSAMANAFLECQPEAKNENLQQQVKPFVLPPLVKRKTSDRPQSSSNSFQTPPISLRRRTTTTLDFPVHSAGSLQRGRRVLCSPTRKNNPQPNGLVFQNAYNRHNKSYEIWDPNSITVESNIPAMMEHLSEREYVFNLSEMAHVYCMSVFPQKNSDRVLDSNFNLF